MNYGFAVPNFPLPFQVFSACNDSGVISIGDSLEYTPVCQLIQCATGLTNPSIPVLSPVFTNMDYISAAVGGTTCQLWNSGGMSSGILVGYSTNAAPFYYSRRMRNVLVLGCGTNDWVAGRSAAQVYSDLLSIVASAQATGFSVAVGTVSSAQRFTMANGGYAWRSTLNSSIVSGAAGHGYSVFDYGDDATIGCDTCWTNSTYFNHADSDVVHLTNAGQVIQASYLQPVLAALGVN